MWKKRIEEINLLFSFYYDTAWADERAAPAPIPLTDILDPELVLTDPILDLRADDDTFVPTDLELIDLTFVLDGLVFELVLDVFITYLFISVLGLKFENEGV